MAAKLAWGASGELVECRQLARLALVFRAPRQGVKPPLSVALSARALIEGGGPRRHATAPRAPRQPRAWAIHRHRLYRA